jgi:hypothetical protein
MNRLLITVLFGLCSTTFVWAGEKYPVEVIKQPDQKWRFRGVIAYSVEETTRITGRLTSHLHGLPRGHVDVAAYSLSGKLIGATTTDYVPSILTRRTKRKGGVRFLTTLDQPLPDGAVVKVAFHRDPQRKKVNPPHTSNIAK